jgi:hypothetical protein
MHLQPHLYTASVYCHDGIPQLQQWLSAATKPGNRAQQVLDNTTCTFQTEVASERLLKALHNKTTHADTLAYPCLQAYQHSCH